MRRIMYLLALVVVPPSCCKEMQLLKDFIKKLGLEKLEQIVAQLAVNNVSDNFYEMEMRDL